MLKRLFLYAAIAMIVAACQVVGASAQADEPESQFIYLPFAATTPDQVFEDGSYLIAGETGCINGMDCDDNDKPTFWQPELISAEIAHDSIDDSKFGIAFSLTGGYGWRFCGDSALGCRQFATHSYSADNGTFNPYMASIGEHTYYGITSATITGATVSADGIFTLTSMVDGKSKTTMINIRTAPTHSEG